MALDNDDIKQLIAILQKGLSEDHTAPSRPIKSKRVATRNSSVPTKKSTKKKPLNKFEKMSEFKMCKEDVEIDKKIKKPPPSPRNRPFDYVKVQCRVCGKKDKVAPALIESTDRYKCNKCSTGAG